MHHVNEYMQWFRLKRQASASSATKYRNILDLYLTFLSERNVSITEATPELVEAFTSRPRRTGRPAGPATVQNELAIVKQFYAWGQARHGWPTNPTTLAAKPRVRNRQPRPVEDETWLTFWLSDLPPVARVITGLGYFCGLRRNELVTLTGGQVWGGSLVNFIRKGGGEDRFDYLDIVAHFQHFLPHLRADLLVEPLERLARERGPARLVPWQSHRPQALNKRLPGWLESAGLPGNAFGPHQLRHSFATNLLSSFVPLDVASDLCNHSSPTITMRYVRTSGGRLASLRGITHTQEARKDGTSYAS